MRNARAQRFRIAGRIAACFLVGIALVGTAGRADAFLPEWAWYISTPPSPRQGWAWQVQRSQFPSLGALSGVPSGEFAVAWFAQPDKIAYLGIGGPAYDSHRATALEVAVDPEAPNLGVETAAIRLCLILSEWEPAEPIPWDLKPTTLCDQAAEGTYDADASAFRFELAALGEALSSAAVQGVSIEPAESPAGAFQVVFKDLRIVMAAREQTSDGLEVQPPSRNRAAETGSEAEAYPAAAAPSSPEQASLSVTRAGPEESPPPRTGRPISMAGVYAGLSALAILLLVGRALAQGGLSSKENEQ